ncbi:MAG: acetyl-CoA decarbonylase/synthase complex subunit delta [Oscillospiraceae bacterium]|nr:acetyl-CoA decarbonylase/synthase complex subunit delta [Oscillospiraceae bacterium]
MAFKRVPQKFNASINKVVVGTGDKTITLGGENVLPFYTFDAPIENKPKVGIMISDTGLDKTLPGIAAFYGDAESLVDVAKKAVTAEGADFLAIQLASANPDEQDASPEDCAAACKAVADAVDMPIAVIGCGNRDKDAKVFDKVAEALSGKNVMILSAREENYKNVVASAGLAYGQKIGAESAVDINLAKQLNTVITQMGFSGENVVMNVGTAAAGYGYEYVASTLDRITAAALGQNDTQLQMPIVTPVATETWNVKECIATEEEAPDWGSREQRVIDMEVITATADLAAGSNAVIVKHPASVVVLSKLVNELI